MHRKLFPGFEGCKWLPIFLIMGVMDPAWACDVFPLDLGLYWTYRGDSGMYTVQVSGVTSVNGADAVTLLSELASGSAEAFYSEVEGEDILCHGYVRDQGDHWEQLFDPPVVMLDCPLTVGKKWETTTTTFNNLEGSGVGTPQTYSYEVLAQEFVYTSAGNFLAYRIVEIVDTVGHEVHFWFVPDVGKVKTVIIDGLFVINAGTIWEYGVPVVSQAWGGFKAGFR